jgi:UDP-4-amino-4,6-dideoxy-N-acetyl-beta-L-altrosamine transaminase
MEYIPYGKHDINEDDIQAVVDVLRSDYITQGPKVPEFEKAVATYTGARYGIAVNSATSALHIACLALGVGQGDVVWTSPITFVASANCAIYCGANVDFVDIDPDTYNMSPNKLRDKLIEAKANNNLPRVVIPVHLAGQSCQMKEIFELSKEFGFSIIEDASHAIGGKYRGRPIGCCEYSAITIFSFHPVKIMTTAEGGMAMTNDEKLANKMNLLRTHGITRNEELMSRKDGQWYYEQIDLGFNFRLTELQAALGISQLSRIDEFVTARNNVAERYIELFAGSNVQTPKLREECLSSYHLFIVRIKNRNLVFNKLRKAMIGVNIHYIPVYKQPYYAKYNYNTASFRCANEYYDTAISLPLYPTLEFTAQQKVVSLILGNNI